MTTKKPFLSRVAVAAFCCTILTQSVFGYGTIYFKNNGSYSGHVWVDGSYQGYVPSGQTRYAVSDGFVTPSGGSVGGWRAGGAVQVVIASTDEKGNNWYAEYNLPEDSGDGRIWFGGPLALNDSDRENAGKIIIQGSGNGPVGMLKGAQTAAKEKRDDGSNKPASAGSSTPSAATKITWSLMAIEAGKSGGKLPKQFIGTWVDDSISGKKQLIIIKESGEVEMFITKDNSFSDYGCEYYKVDKIQIVNSNKLLCPWLSGEETKKTPVNTTLEEARKAPRHKSSCSYSLSVTKEGVLEQTFLEEDGSRSTSFNEPVPPDTYKRLEQK